MWDMRMSNTTQVGDDYSDCPWRLAILSCIFMVYMVAASCQWNNAITRFEATERSLKSEKIYCEWLQRQLRNTPPTAAIHHIVRPTGPEEDFY